jgi:hypothetical protein
MRKTGLLEQTESLDVLTGALGRPGPALVFVSQSTEMGIPSVLASALSGTPLVHLACSELSDLEHREQLDLILSRAFGPGPPPAPASPFGTPSGPVPKWGELVASVPVRGSTSEEGGSSGGDSGGSTGSVRAVVLTEAQRLAVANPRFLDDLADGWESVRRDSRPVILALCFGPGGIPQEIRSRSTRLMDLGSVSIDEDPLTIRGVAESVPDWKPVTRMLTWALFGGARGRIALVDPARSLRRNVERLLLDPEGPLHREMDGFLRRPSLTQPARYATALGLVARGARDWRDIRRGLESRGQGRPGPYVAKLRDLDILRASQSLDAVGGQRSTRYHVADPLVRAWFAWVLPHRSRLLAGELREVWESVLKPELHRALPGMLTRAIVELLTFRGLEKVGPRARVAGGLWGAGYDIPVAATLRNGAICYGTVRDDWAPTSGMDLERLSAHMRETRYGFGREVRLRVLASLVGHHPDLERTAARDERVRLVGPTDLVGD